MLATVSPGTFTMTRCTAFGSSTPSWRATQPRSAISASTRPMSSWNPVPSVLPTSATSESGFSVPASTSSWSLDVSFGIAMGHTCISTRWTLTRSPPLHEHAGHGKDFVLAERPPHHLDSDRQPVGRRSERDARRGQAEQADQAAGGQNVPHALRAALHRRRGTVQRVRRGGGDPPEEGPGSHHPGQERGPEGGGLPPP